jgi:hypothetical protein
MTAYGDCDIMVLLPYTPRADAAARGYDDWLRSVDNPFFNAVRGIAHYSNWKVDRVLWGTVGFTHFDYMRLDPAYADEVWSNPAVTEFAANWTRTWGAEPDAADLSVNYHSYRLRRVSGRAAFARATLLGIGAGVTAGGDGDELWVVEQPMVGTPPAQRFVIREAVAAQVTAEWADTVVSGTLIAAP